MVLQYNFPIQVAWEVTGRCNFRCKYCLNCSGPANKDMTSGERSRIVEELVNNKVLDVIISGGEPLLLGDIYSILERLKLADVNITLLTNGAMLNKTRCERLKGLVDVMQISMDTTNPDIQDKFTNAAVSFEKMRGGIDAALAAGLPVEIGAVLTRLNCSGIGHLAEFCLEKGIKHLTLSEIMLEGRALENKKELLIGREERLQLIELLAPFKDKLKITGHEPALSYLFSGKNCVCDCSLVSCAIAYNGDVLPCSYIRETVGSVRTAGLKDIWRSDVFSKYREAVVQAPSGGCSKCSQASSCRGGCKGLSWSYTGQINASNPICVYDKCSGRL